jgi:NlpC/P60 family putative phage cell wall peptidase
MSPHIERAAFVAEARRWIGTPYLHQGSLLSVGCDCLGLVRGVWRALIGPEPEVAGPYAPDWAEASGVEALALAGARHFAAVAPEAFQAGDVLLFRWRANVPAKHLAIAASSQTMIHAHDGACVAEVALSPWWRRRLAYAFAFPGVA